MTDEAALLKRARAYDEKALEEIYEEYAPLMYAYIYRRVGDRMAAESMVGDVFVRMLDAIQSERAWRTSFRGWLYRIAHNLIVDHHRSRPDEPVVPLEGQEVSSEGDPEEALSERVSRKRLLSAVRQLTPGQQQVLVLRFGEGLTARETAAVMEKSVSAVEALQHRGLAALRRVLKGG
ncbi:MAG: sigma-70 family RNA polymerase sigma factor [Chloroflexota bacterium]|nr:sigma-70 family RNA polymerase sigma factor [Chloroflexota bacterium]